jgi:5-methylcytosine-specific restriction endonuclease McrA
MSIPIELDRRVRLRSKELCEYCRLPQWAYPWTFQVDHIIAEQHLGKTQMSNLALACPRCNRRKGPNLS